MDNSIIAVIIPVYNRCYKVCRAIDSVLTQSFKKTEIIVIDDASDDNLYEVMELRYPQVKYLRNDLNKGVSYSRNRGIRNAKSEWIAFLDSDDQWDRNKLQLQMDGLIKTGNLINHTNEVWYRRGKHLNQKKKHRKMGGEFFLQALPLCIISPSSILMHRKIFDEAGFFDEGFEVCEDYEMWLRLTLQYRIDFIDRPLTIKHGGHPDQLSCKYYGMDRWRIQALVKTLENLGHKMTPKQKKAVREEICKKAGIYANGAGKRGKIQEREKYLSIIDLYSMKELK